MQVVAADAQSFFDGRRLALVGASDDPKNLARTVYTELKSHGCTAVAVNRNGQVVDGDPCYASLHDVPGELDGVIVMVNKEAAADVVRDCIALDIKRVWLFKGAGGGAVSDEAVALCEANGLDVVAGACPLMFLEPVAWFHRLHRGIRHLNGSLSKAS